MSDVTERAIKDCRYLELHFVHSSCLIPWTRFQHRYIEALLKSSASRTGGDFRGRPIKKCLAVIVSGASASVD